MREKVPKQQKVNFYIIIIPDEINFACTPFWSRNQFFNQYLRLTALSVSAIVGDSFYQINNYQYKKKGNAEIGIPKHLHCI